MQRFHISCLLLWSKLCIYSHIRIFTKNDRTYEMVESKKNNQSNEEEVEEVSVVNRCVEDTATETLPMSAYITLVFLFFQIASLIHAEINEQKEKSTSQERSSGKIVRRTLFAFFNFRVSVGGKLCPMIGLTIPTKEFLNIALKLCSIANLLLCFLIWRCFVLVKRCSIALSGKVNNMRNGCPLTKYTCAESI